VTQRRMFYPILVFLFLGAISCGTDAPPAANNPENNGTCEDRCVLGDRSCLDPNTVEVCRRNPLTGCFALERSVCAGNESCLDGDCLEEPKECEDTCLAPASRCNNMGQPETCADHTGDGCFEFGAPQSCQTGEVCDQVDGLCKPVSCTDQCIESSTICQEGLLSTCSLNPQGCLTHGSGKQCEAGFACEGTMCVESSACEDECELGQSICSPQGVLTCGNFDADACTELSSPVPCPANSECRNGACVPVSTCQDRCLANEAACVGNDISRCQAQADGCLAFSNPTPCPGNETCVADIGSTTCQAPATSGKVVINEVFYDAIGADVRPNGTSPTFIELFGPAGLSIAGYKVEFVNGSGGATYGSFTLPAGAKLDGNGFAILGMTTPDSFLSLAVSTNKYFIMTPYAAGQDAIQNGPDNVKLLNASNTVIDAVGYGTFAANEIFEGEGQPAPRATPGRSIGRKNGIDTDNNSADFLTYYPTPGQPNSDLIINEIYFDQPGIDDGSETFVEIVAPIQGWEDLPLNGYVLRAINGLNGQDYIFTFAGGVPVLDGIDFSGYNLNEGPSDGYVVVCNIDKAGNTLLNLCTVPFEGDDFQNGPDNFVLEYQGRVIDAVGYGNFGATDVFVGEGQPRSFSSSSAGKSLGRWPMSDPSRAPDTDNNAVDFHLMTPSPAQDNTP